MGTACTRKATHVGKTPTHINKNNWTFKTKESKNALCCLHSRAPWDLDRLINMKIFMKQNGNVRYHLQCRWLISLTCTTVSLLKNKANLCPVAAVLPREFFRRPLEASFQDLRVEKSSEQERMKHTKDGANLWTSSAHGYFPLRSNSICGRKPPRKAQHWAWPLRSLQLSSPNSACLPEVESACNRADVCGPCSLRALDPS